MLRRLYLISIRSDASPERVGELVRVLEEAPAFIPSMRWSRVSSEISRNPYDLVWDNSFEDEAGFQDYLLHPYHANVIDHYMYLESPAAIITEATTCLHWMDGSSSCGTFPNSAETPEMPQEVQEMTEIDGEGAAARARDDGPIFLLEHVDIVPGKSTEYLRAVRESYLPRVGRHGMELKWVLRSPDGSGEDALDLLWEIPGWADWARIRTAINSDKEWLLSWLAVIESLRTGGSRRFVLADDVSSGAPSH
jgi:Stress responsive A/B Barrel Domain